MIEMLRLQLSMTLFVNILYFSCLFALSSLLSPLCSCLFYRIAISVEPIMRPSM